jgi:hypothetical protein
VGISKLGWTGKDIQATRMYVSPSSGDCARGLDQSLPATVSGRSLFRWQRPKVIENASRHEPVRLTKSANGSRANRANEQNHGRASGAMTFDRRRRACHSLISLCVASAPPVKASLRLACSLRSQRSALTGPGSDAGDFRDEGMAGFVHSARDHPVNSIRLTSTGLLMEAHGASHGNRQRTAKPRNGA